MECMRPEVWGIAIASRLFHVDPFSILAFVWWRRSQQWVDQFHLAYTLNQLCSLSLCPSDWTNTTPCDIVARRSTRSFSGKTKNTQFISHDYVIVRNHVLYRRDVLHSKALWNKIHFHVNHKIYTICNFDSQNESFIVHIARCTVRCSTKEPCDVCPMMTAYPV